MIETMDVIIVQKPRLYGWKIRKRSLRYNDKGGSDPARNKAFCIRIFTHLSQYDGGYNTAEYNDYFIYSCLLLSEFCCSLIYINIGADRGGESDNHGIAGSISAAHRRRGDSAEYGKHRLIKSMAAYMDAEASEGLTHRPRLNCI